MLICFPFFLTARPMNLSSPNLESTRNGKARPQIYVPEGSNKLLSQGCKVTSSAIPLEGNLSYITDGNKENEAYDEKSMVKLEAGIQWVQIDLKTTQEVFAVCIWRHHYLPRIYRDVIVQLSNDPAFLSDVTTVFNNDHDNSSGLGIGHDKEYIEWNNGRPIAISGIHAQYIRVYSNGSYTGQGEINLFNCYTEIEVYGGHPLSKEKIPLHIEVPKPQFL